MEFVDTLDNAVCWLIGNSFVSWIQGLNRPIFRCSKVIWKIIAIEQRDRLSCRWYSMHYIVTQINYRIPAHHLPDANSTRIRRQPTQQHRWIRNQSQNRLLPCELRLRSEMCTTLSHQSFIAHGNSFSIISSGQRYTVPKIASSTDTHIHSKFNENAI